MCKHATGINNTHPKQYLILYSSYLFKWKLYVYYFDFFLLHIYIYIYVCMYICFLAKVSYSCYVLEISLFQIFIYTIHSVGISFIYVAQILFSLGHFNYHMGTIGYEQTKARKVSSLACYWRGRLCFGACYWRGRLCFGRGRDRSFVCIFLYFCWWVCVCLYTRVHTHKLLGYLM